MELTEVLNISDWQVFQQKNNKADINVSFKITEGSWLKKPISDEEKRFSKIFYGIKIRCIDENTGRIIENWVECRQSNGLYEGVLKNIPTGGPYKIQKLLVFNDDGNFIEWAGSSVVEHIGVGDIFLIAGQSNAAGWARGLYFDEIDMNLRSYNNGKWNVASQPLGNNENHSPFLVFGKMLSKSLGYPIGLIPRAVGGSPITTWIDGGAHTENLKKENINALKGILWYQGCEEAGTNSYETYEDMFMNFLVTMRKLFCDDKLPVITFQLNRLLSSQNYEESINLGWENIRNVQQEIAKKHENVYIIPTIDLKTMSDHIHNSVSSNKTLGERCALYALDCIYGKEKFKAPELKKAVKLAQNIFMLEFDNVAEELCTFEMSPKNLPVIAEDSMGINEIEKYEASKNKIKIYTKRNIENDTKIKIHCGANPQYIIIDRDTQLPVVCIKNIELSPKHV